MNYASWPHKAMLSKGYPPNSVRQLGSMQATGGPKQRAGLDDGFGHPQGVHPHLVTVMRYILLLFSLCWRNYNRVGGNFLNALGIGCLLY